MYVNKYVFIIARAMYWADFDLFPADVVSGQIWYFPKGLPVFGREHFQIRSVIVNNDQQNTSIGQFKWKWAFTAQEMSWGVRHRDLPSPFLLPYAGREGGAAGKQEEAQGGCRQIVLVSRLCKTTVDAKKQVAAITDTQQSSFTAKKAS